MTQERGPNRRGLHSREEILEAAARVMAERGYAGTSISTISRASGLPKSAIYHHFSSKAGLLSAVVERGLDAFFAALRTTEAAPQGSYSERLGWYLRRTATVFESHRDFLRLHLLLVMSEEAAETEVSSLTQLIRERGRQHMETTLASAFERAGREQATQIAASLSPFALAGFDGAFVATQADAARDMATQLEQLTAALVALAEQLIAAGRDEGLSARP